jgi:hypothetical protein
MWQPFGATSSQLGYRINVTKTLHRANAGRVAAGIYRRYLSDKMKTLYSCKAFGLAVVPCMSATCKKVCTVFVSCMKFKSFVSANFMLYSVSLRSFCYDFAACVRETGLILAPKQRIF